DVLNPADKSVVAKAPLATEKELNEAVAAAKAAFPSWSGLEHSERRNMLLKLADAVEENAEELKTLLSKEQGKPLKGFGNLGAGFEFDMTLNWIRTTADFELKTEVIEENDSFKVEIHRKPLGVVGSITPWNFPLMISIWHIIPAMLAGNTVVMKPSEMTPLTMLRFGEIAQQVLPPGVLNIVSGAGELGALISGHEDIRKIVFTGSTPTGKAIMKSGAVNLKRLTLELGGNDAGIVLDDVDVDDIAEKIFASAFINNGQTCAALKRLYVHESVHDHLCEALTKIATSMKNGNGLDEDTDLGPLQNEKQLNIVKDLAEDAKIQGATFLCGGEIVNEEGFFYPPTLVSNIKDGSKLVDTEQFGPILPIIKFSTIEEALKGANGLEIGLGGSVWSKDIAKASEVAEKMECGTVWINNHAAVLPIAPFGGVKQSGFGVEFGDEGLTEYTSVHTIHTYK
uniref:aldehyde dehydrogenase family protein n=1 Tax=Psychrobacter sp. TaxID=56811 RepID=UPI0025D7E370